MKKSVRNEVSAIVIIIVVLAIGVLGYIFRQNLGFKASTLETFIDSGSKSGVIKKTFSVNKTTAVADGNDSITLTGGSFMVGDLSNPNYSSGRRIDVTPNDATVNNPKPYCVTSTFIDTDTNTVLSSSNVIDTIAFGAPSGGDTIDGNSYVSGDKVYIYKKIDCNTGLVSVSLRSTTPGVKKVGIAYNCKGDCIGDYILSLDVTFTDPNASTTNTSTGTTSTSSDTSTKSTTKKSTTSSGSAATTNTTAATTTPEITSVSTTTGATGSTGSSVYQVGDPITFSGTATANSTVNLFIYSDPIQVSTTTDENGNWTYTYTDALPEGDHRVEAQVVLADGTTSDKTEIANFVVQPKTVTETKDNSKLYYYIAAGALLILIIIIIILIHRRKRKAEATDGNDLEQIEIQDQKESIQPVIETPQQEISPAPTEPAQPPENVSYK